MQNQRNKTKQKAKSQKRQKFLECKPSFFLTPQLLISYFLKLPCTLKSLSSLLGDFFRDFWPGFLALDQNGDGTDGRDGRTEYSFTVLLGRRNTVLQYYWDGEIQCTVLLGQRNTVYSTTGTEKYRKHFLRPENFRFMTISLTSIKQKRPYVPFLSYFCQVFLLFST